MILEGWDLSELMLNNVFKNKQSLPLRSKKSALLFVIFLLALVLRFLYFPQNTYFGFDQARDAFASLEIIKGDIKVVGPPAANQVLHHGVLYYYIFAPFYLISGGDPAAVSTFLRILNASGIFLLFLLVYPMFGMAAALLSSLLFALSFEQTQFSLFLNHPSLAVISVLLFYLGLSTWIFRKETWGLFLALFGLGLSIQFEFVETQLIVVFILFILFLRKSIPKLSFQDMALGFLAFLIPVSTYVVSEIKNNLPVIRKVANLSQDSSESLYSLISHINQIFWLMNRHLQDNLAANSIISIILGIVFLSLIIVLTYKNVYRKQLIFLAIWFFGGFLVYFFIKNDAYFYNTGTSISILIFTAFLLSKFFRWNKWVTTTFLILILISNLYLITKNNPLGPNPKINPQIGLLLKDEQRVLDFIYQNASGDEFSVNALTMPYNVNTTWSYLFEWYGKKRYGYVPIWGGDAAEGFPGNLQIERARSKLPDKRFLIIEPTEGIPTYLIDSFIASEENYTTTIEKRNIGTMQVWVQQPK